MAKTTKTSKKFKKWPRCNELWSASEIKIQECDSCGYPEDKDIDLNGNYTDDEDDFFDEGL